MNCKFCNTATKHKRGFIYVFILLTGHSTTILGCLLGEILWDCQKFWGAHVSSCAFHSFIVVYLLQLKFLRGALLRKFAKQIKLLTFPFSKKRAVFIWSLYLYLQSIRIRKRLNDSQRHSHEAGGFDLKKIKVKSSSNQKKTNGGKWKTQDRRYYKCVHVGSRALKQ